jgi:hypothetical protein
VRQTLKVAERDAERLQCTACKCYVRVGRNRAGGGSGGGTGKKKRRKE